MLVVAGLVVVFVGVVGVVGVVVVLVGVVGVVVVCVGVVVVGAVGVVGVVGVLGTFAHCRRASWAIVETPWVRLFRSVELIDEGRLMTSSASLLVAFETSPQFWLASAEDTESSWLFSEDASLPESRPEPPPQATTNAAANPSAPARTARDA
ncbi:MAG: hypothetical protein ACXVR0_11920 [Solirubrobacteraceae bacterium]